MSEAPKEIWCQSDTPNHMSDIRELAQRPRDEVLDAFTHYTRTEAISPQTAAKVLLEAGSPRMTDVTYEWLRAIAGGE